MEYRSRTFRIDDEVWEAVQKHELSANQLLRRVLRLDVPVVETENRGRSLIQPPAGVSSLDAIGPELSSGRGKASTETFRRGPRQKGDTKR